jgi:transcriptional regulator HilA, main transcriptional regulator of SPI1
MNAEPGRDGLGRTPEFESLPASATATVWRFSGFEFSADRGLRHDDEPVDLQPKGRSLLALLLRANGAVVGKETIAAALWPGRPVSDDSIARVVSLLRKALRRAGDDPVKTIYGEGIRLDVEVLAVRAPTVSVGVRESREALVRNAYEAAADRTTSGLRAALRLLRHAVESFPDFAEASSLMAIGYGLLALRGSLAAKTAREQIARHAAQALAIDARNASALAMSGWALAILDGKIEAGGGLLDTALEIAPHDACTCFTRAWVAAEKRDLNLALREVESGLAHVPFDRDLRGIRAALLLCTGRIDEADAFAQQSLGSRPDVDLLLDLRSVAASLRGDHVRAIAFAEQAVRISGGERMQLSYLAYALAIAGRREEAQKAYQGASVGFAVSAFLAPAKLALGDPEAARAILQRAEKAHCPWRSLMWCDPRLAALRAGADRSAGLDGRPLDPSSALL